MAVPQLAQKRLAAGLAAPQLGQLRVASTWTGAPQCMQNRAPDGTGWPQEGHAVVSLTPAGWFT
jgi:hypothetical protein